MIVRILEGVEITKELDLDRVPIKGEYIWLSENDLRMVLEVHWGVDGHASLFLQKNFN